MTRRCFLRVSSGFIATTGLSFGPSLLAQTQPGGVSSTALSARRRWEKSVVVKARSDFVSDAPAVRQNVMTGMFESAFKVLAKTETVREAWHRYLRADDIVGLKFNPYGERELGISMPFASMLVNSLIQSGWSAEQIVLADGPAEVAKKYKTRPRRLGWSAMPIDFGSARDQLASFLQQVTAIINVPFLKDDNITGISGCLKNITYHLIKHPARFHANGCSPYLADIFALPQISGKLRLNIMNALRTAYHNGPLVDPNYMDNTGLLLLGPDPVAVDAVALDALNAVRQSFDLPPITLDAQHVPALIDAAEKGLGRIDFRKIERVLVSGY